MDEVKTENKKNELSDDALGGLVIGGLVGLLLGVLLTKFGEKS